ncbi:mucoidy inhibitor MuiA family protein [Saprospiraceae bacterium]|nr:mucoidy inhibitor MuiA family protein [Saprospiraceae bacterium]
MKKLTTLMFVLGIYVLSTAATPTNEPTTPPTKITDVTIYSSGAQVTILLDTKGKTGKTELVLKGLPIDVNRKSIIIEADDNIEIISFNSSIEYKIEKVGEDLDIEKIRKQIAMYQDSIDYAQCSVTALDAEQNLIKDHNDFETEDGGADVEAVIRASEFYRVRLKEIATELVTVKKQIAQYSGQMQLLRQEVAKIDARYVEQELRVTINVDIKGSIEDGIKVMYFTKNARWYPYYDLKVDGVEDGIRLLRKAYVSQNTGQDWDDIKLTLSNADPSLSSVLPNLTPYNLTDNNPHLVAHAQGNTVSGIVVDNAGEPLIGAGVILQGRATGTTTDINGQFFLPNGKGHKLVISYVGYSSEIIDANRNYIQVIMKQGEQLDEISIRGSRSNSSLYYIDGVRAGSSKRKENDKKVRQPIRQVKLESINSVEYAIEKPYSIASDDKEIDILLDEEKIDALFGYYTVPLKNENAYLIAKIPNWHELDMLSGSANLFLKNTYKGSTHINPKSTEDTLSISLGIDPEVIVSRKQLREKYDKKFFGKNAEECMSYEIIVKNNKSKPIDIEIYDQVPIVSHDDIKVSIEETSNAQLKKDTGILKWDKSMSAGQQEKMVLSYKVKYPQDMHVVID